MKEVFPLHEQIGFIGLGQLGLPMANNLLDSGYALTLFNRTASRADPLLAKGARLASSPVDALLGGGVVVTVLWDSDAVEALVASDGFLDRLGPGGLHICMCTGSPEAARRLAALHAGHGSLFVEAPVFGRPEAAAARKLWIPFAGTPAAKQRALPLLTAMGAQGVFDFGEQNGAATIVKLVGNFLIASAARSLFEGLGMARKAGVDPQAIVDMLTRTLFPAPIYQNYGKLIASGAPPFSQTAIPRKDLGLFEAVAQASGMPTPSVHHLLEMLQSEAH